MFGAKAGNQRLGQKAAIFGMCLSSSKQQAVHGTLSQISPRTVLTGPNTELLVQIAEKTGKPVVASGGISTLDDIAKLAGMVDRGIEGAIIGKALYANQFTLEQALQVASGTAVKDV